MKHGTLVIPVEQARNFVDKLGKSCSIQFQDMNSKMMVRPYKKYIQRFDDMERMLRFIQEEMRTIPGQEIVKDRIDDFLENDTKYKMDEVESELKRLYEQFLKFKENNTEMNDQRNSAIEEKWMTETAIFTLKATGPMRSGEAGLSAPLLEEQASTGIGAGFNNIAGVLLQADQDRFARTIFRASRGNAFTYFQAIPNPLKDPKTNKLVDKTVFVIYFQDVKSSTSAMHDKIKKICQAFGVNVYRWPADKADAEKRRAYIDGVIQDKEKALAAFERFMTSETQSLFAVQRGIGNSLIEEYRLFVLKEKSIYHTLNMMEGDINLMASCWYAEIEEEKIKALLIRESKATGCSAMLVSDKGGPGKRRPPTYIRSNAFLAPFQELINTYGIPKYKEANPACLYSVTFPFMFGIMYGDVGHGTMLFLVGLYLVWKGESLKFSAPDVYNARYFVAMMGFYAIFAGLMYNDFFSIGLNLFGSRWVVDREEGGSIYFKADYDITNSGAGRGPYPFGVDPAWHGTSNELLFINSLKMKLSVLIGVAQMLVGVALRFSNGFYEMNFTDIICECCPMLAFMICFFAYMDFMILYKWVTPIETAPSIINSLICMAMGQKDTAPLWDGSIALEKNLMTITMLSVPIMLIPKPVTLWLQNKAKKPEEHSPLEEEEEAGGHGHGGEFKLDEVIIHQIIETIEYVLGTVSHTASYLRLWALSLAHQQLSLVFFQKTILGGLSMPFPANGIMLYFMYAAWFGITCGVLLGMDVLECFLHDLRLHWVEFQSKFYNVGGDGHMFTPYKHTSVLAPKSD
jgi:V-type H+-transporting ATPase subunit a